MTIVALIIVLIGLAICRQLGRMYYRNNSASLSYILLIIVAFLAPWIALMVANSKELWSVRPRWALWTGFIISALTALISLLLNKKDCDGKACTCTGACNCASGACSTDGSCADGSCEKMPCGCKVGNCTCKLPCGCKKGNCTCNVNKAKSAAASVAAPVAAAAFSGKPDDLKVVEGIGPVIEKHLNDHGVHTYEMLASMEGDAVKEILNRAGDRFINHKPGTRPEQATLARDGKWDELKVLTDLLDGGVRK